MKTRLRFTKTGSLKFIGHLDCMRFFQKAMRRAKLELSYTKGFHPHPVMSFASPLSVGLTSDGEYLDVEFERLPDLSDGELVEYLNQFMTEELFVTEIHHLDDKSKTSMALLCACDYVIHLRDGKKFSTNVEPKKNFKLRESFENFMEKNQILIRKKTKRSEAQIDLKPLILQYAFSGKEFEEKTGEKLPKLHYEFDSEDELYLKLVSGSAMNIKPELVLEAYMKELEVTMSPFACQIHRIQMHFEEENREGRKNV